MCSQIRGVEEKDSAMESITTIGKLFKCFHNTFFKGKLKSDSALITQFLSLVKN